MQAVPDSEALDAAMSPDALVSLDAGRRVVGVNRQFTRLLGIGVAEAVGADFAGLVSLRDADANPRVDWHASAHLPSARAIPQIGLDLRHVGGRVIKTTVTATYLRGDGRLIGAVLSLRDASHSRIDSAAAQVVATVSHEVRAPLTGIQGFASLLLNRGEDLHPRQRREMLEQILADAQRMARLVGELLDVSRLEAGRVTFRPEVVDVATAVDAAVGTLDVSVEVQAGTAVIADRDKLARVLSNLVENAVRHGEVPLRVTAGAEGGATTIDVSDAGRIPAEVQERIFSRYWHRDRPGSPAGTGLGLYIARGLAEAMDGTLTVTSGTGGGTTFRLTLPSPWQRGLDSP